VTLHGPITFDVHNSVSMIWLRRLADLKVHLTQHLCLQEHKAELRFERKKPRQDEALYDNAADDGEHAEGKLFSEVQSVRERGGLRCQLVL